jgi:hypothetical protein
MLTIHNFLGINSRICVLSLRKRNVLQIKFYVLIFLIKLLKL